MYARGRVPQGLGDLAAHLVAFHNMGASPSHDDPFVSGGKVSFDDGDPPEGGDGAQSPHAHNSQAYNTSPLLEQDRAFDGSDRVRLRRSSRPSKLSLSLPPPAAQAALFSCEEK